jgi:predicted aspartyl protease
MEVANYQDIILSETGHLPADKVRRVRLQGVVDSGAVRLVLPKKVADALGVPHIGTVGVRYADGRRARRVKVKDVWLRMLDRESTFNATVEPKRKDALIGAIVMEDLDLVVDCVSQRLRPRDPKGIVSEIE